MPVPWILSVPYLTYQPTLRCVWACKSAINSRPTSLVPHCNNLRAAYEKLPFKITTITIPQPSTKLNQQPTSTHLPVFFGQGNCWFPKIKSHLWASHIIASNSGDRCQVEGFLVGSPGIHIPQSLRIFVEVGVGARNSWKSSFLWLVLWEASIPMRGSTFFFENQTDRFNGCTETWSFTENRDLLGVFSRARFKEITCSNLKITWAKRKIIFQTFIFGFHVLSSGV